jgi:hypothetical protein
MGSQTRLVNFFSRVKSRLVHTLSLSTNDNPKQVPPCPGISGAQDERIPDYLKRTSETGGGSRSVVKIALDLYQKTYAQLSTNRKDIVDETQRIERTWVNDHRKLRIFSTTCTNVACWSSENTFIPCQKCRSLLRDSRLCSVLNKPTPEERNFRHLNQRFQNHLEGLQYARVKGLKQLIESAVRTVKLILEKIT